MADEWQELTFGDICDEIYDGPHATPKKLDEGPIFLSISSLDNGRLDLSQSLCLSEDDFKKWTRRVTPKKDDLVFSYETRLGEAALIPEGLRCCLGRRMALIRPHTEIVDPKYLLFYFLSRELQNEINKYMICGSTVERLALADIPKFKIKVPPLSEQKAIANILGTLDDKIELNRKMNATLESMAQAMFKSWFVDFDPVIDNALAAGNPIPEPLQQKAQTRKGLGDQKKPLPPDIQKLFPNSFQINEELGWIPEGWEVNKFGSLLESTIGGDWGKETEDEKHDLNVVIIRGADINEIKNLSRGKAPSRWVERKKYASRSLDDGDIVIEVSGGSANQSTGRSVYITKSMLQFLGGSVVPASFCRKFRPIDRHVGLYLAMHLEHIYSIGKMWSYQIQSTGISNFQTSTFLDMEQLAIPNQIVLSSFFEQARPIVNRITAHESNELAQLRDILLPKLLTGELRIPVAEKLVGGAT